MTQQGEKLYEGKAKILYATDDPALVIQYFKDDATAFNAQKKGTIMDKGVVNNKVSGALFTYLESKGVPTHFKKQLDDRSMLVNRLEIVPLEVTIRNITAGGHVAAARHRRRHRAQAAGLRVALQERLAGRSVD